MKYATAQATAALLAPSSTDLALVARSWQVMKLSVAASLTREHVAAALAVTLSACLWFLPQDLSLDGRVALIILSLSIIGWTMTRIGDTTIALVAAIALAGTGVIHSEDVFASLGHEMIWLMIAAFAMSAVLRKSGVIERIIFSATGRSLTVSRLFYALTGIIAATAFVIPSTSGRAALLLPVFLVLAQQLKRRPLVRALALLFPTVILLSASGSLIGAGAHLVAAEIIAEKTGAEIGFFQWMSMNLPFALATSFAATWIILRTFLSPRLCRIEIDLRMARPHEAISPQQLLIGAILMATVLLWISEPVHGLGAGLVAVAGAVAMLQASRNILKAKEAFKSVETELLVFLAATFVIASALTKSGADTWMAAGLLEALPEAIAHSTAVVVAIVAAVSLAAHLFVNSRSARAAVLIPAFTLPVAGLGHDLTLLVMVTVAGTGFCQTLTASAKPVAIYAQSASASYTNPDLMRLSLALLPMMFLALMFFGLFVWPNF